MAKKKRAIIYIFLSMGFFLSGCLFKKDYRTVEDIKKSGYIEVLTRTAGTTFYKNKEGIDVGFELELARLYAKSIGVEVKMIPMPSISAVLEGVEKGHGDFAASGLTKTDKRQEKLIVSHPYQKIFQSLVCNSKFLGKELKDLQGVDMVILKGSSYEENLESLKKDYPGLSWTPISDLSSGQIMQMVWERGPTCTVVDSHIASVNRRFMPEVNEVMKVSGEQELVWYINKKNTSLQQSINRWMSTDEVQSEINRLSLQYYGQSVDVNHFDLAVFQKKIQDDLPKYDRLFKRAAKRFDLDWRVLAAIAYQESRWAPEGKNPNGGVGMLMLTPSMGKNLGVTDLTDPVQNIFAGAKYLAEILSKLPQFIPLKDRTWMAVAAFNIGFNHIQDARRVCVDLNFDPNSWESLVKVLPLLSQNRYYKDLKHGYAQGVQPVVFVRRVKEFSQHLK